MTLRPLITRAIAVVALIGAVGGLAVQSAAADDGDITWGIHPSTPTGPDGRNEFSFQVAPGTAITDWVGVVNDSSVAATFRVYAADATTDYDTAAFTLIGSDQGSAGLGAWTSIDNGPAVCSDTNDAAETACAAALGVSVTLDPGASKNIPFTIVVPQDATPGDHSAGIVASYATTGGGDGTTIRREDRVGTRIYLRVDGPLSPGIGVQGAVAGFDASLNPIGGGTARAGFDISNLGNSRVSVQPEVRLTGPFGIALGTVTLPPVQNIVPGGVAHVEAELPGTPPLLLVTANIALTAIPAGGIAAADPLPASVTTSAVAWAVPWMLLLIVVVVIAAIALIVWRRRRSRQLLAEDLAAYADEIREQERAAASTAAAVPTQPESETVR
ncbi:hypothetical protein [uncultured Microbacterium sp.]|uniref:hypothetical protein n=1 Tax=uncultured Microbacterium sp. TaxID=191216 RepID=UPI0035CC89D6